LRHGGLGFRPGNFDLFPGTRMMRQLRRPAVNEDMALFDQTLDRAARNDRKTGPKK
jgi:hypothetical protein